MDLKNKVIFVSGATSAIGMGIALECARAGASLILSGRDPDRLQKSASMIGSSVAHCLVMDLEDIDGIAASITELHGQYKIDGFVHAAGLHEIIPLQICKPERLMRAFTINAIAGIQLSRLMAHPKLANSDLGASHVFISSVSSHKAEAGLLAYSSSKAALTAAVRGLAVELAPKKIRVNALTLGWVNTPAAARTLEAMGTPKAEQYTKRYPLGLGEISDVSNGILFLLSQKSRWMTGTELIMDGGVLA